MFGSIYFNMVKLRAKFRAILKSTKPMSSSSGFYFMMGFFLPRIKSRSAHRANAQAAATGQIVDTVSNISIVKLFANSSREDNAAMAAFKVLKMSLRSYGWELIRFRTLMVLYASILFFGVMVSCVYLWIGGSASAGEVVVAGSVAMRIDLIKL